MHNLISVSGGKDSTATLLVALEREVENISAVFADTGHEHPLVYEYLDYLEGATGVKINRVKADFSNQIAHKRDVINTKWRKDGVADSVVDRALTLLVPTGVPFLDMCLWKGRFPSSKARFCTEELKINPIQDQIIWPLLREAGVTIDSWQGIRWDESPARAKSVEREGIDPDASRVFAYRPILSWTAADVFAMHSRHGIRWNPLYELGMGRVGCMPCVNCSKGELREIADRFPDEIERVSQWEKLVALVSKRGGATFFPAVIDPTVSADDDIQVSTHGINRAVDWSRTARGGRQFDLIGSDRSPNQCASIYGLCA